jgi:threonine/homoserine/homoserine lactone efflux protein
LPIPSRQRPDTDADAIYGGFAAFGVTAISSFLISQQFWFRLMGGIAICGLGIRIYQQALSQKISTPNDHTNCVRAYFSALILTLMNPALIISFAAIFASLKIACSSSHHPSTLLLVAGVFSGSAIWWVILSGVASRLQSRFTDTFIQKIKHVSGALIAGFGLLLVGSLFVIK